MFTDKGDIKGPFSTYRPILIEYGCSDEDILFMQNKWNEPNRFYHNQEHLLNILSLIESNYLKSEEEYKKIVMVAFFHDVIYDPKSKTNEDDSNDYFLKICKGKLHDLKDISFAILDTKDHVSNYEKASSLSKRFMELDLYNLIHGDISEMLEDEKKIFKEFGFVEYSIYKEKRLEILLQFSPLAKKINKGSKIDYYIEVFKLKIPNIAIFPGTFDPWHVGHSDILVKAEKIFDKVIILIGNNPKKKSDFGKFRMFMPPMIRESLGIIESKYPNNEIVVHQGFLHSYIKKLKYPVTIIKGLRNSSDFEYEKNQQRYIEDFYPEIKITYIIGDRSIEHISSSGIRAIEAIGE